MAGTVPDAWRYADICGFEHVPVGGRTALIRLSATASRSGGTEGPRPLLVADDGETVSRFVAIPAPADAGDELRAAYSVPASLVTPDTVFCLEFDDDYVVSLPEPTVGAARVNSRGPAPADPAAGPVAEAPAPAAPGLPAPPAEPADGGAQEDRRADMPSQFTVLSAELADARRENSELRTVAEQARQSGQETRESLLHLYVVLAETDAELTAMRDLDDALAAAGGGRADDGRVPELELSLAEAERVRDAALADHDAALTERDAVLVDRDSVVAERDAVVAERDAVVTARDAAVAERDEALAERDAAFAERDAAFAARDEAEQSVEPLRKARVRAERDLDELREELRLVSLEREELDRQATAFDGVAVKARERASEAEAEAARAAARLGELETWSAELERRLAGTTTQLADAQARIESDELELRRLNGELAEARAQTELDRAALARGGSLASVASAAPEPVRVAPAVSEATAGPRERSPLVSPTLEQLGRAAVAEAHRLAERELADHDS